MRPNERQSDNPLSLVKKRCPFHVTFPLRVNCRNTSAIAAGVELVGKLVPGYSRFLRTESSMNIDAQFYNSEHEQSAKLLKRLESLGKAHKPEEIVILSSKRDELSAAAQLKKVQSHAKGYPLRPFRESMKSIGVARYATIHAFKGLEAPAIVMTDIDDLRTDMSASLLYVGMSRARVSLSLLMHEKCRSQWLELLKEGLVKRAQTRNLG